jgi:hypothetical protein
MGVESQGGSFLAIPYAVIPMGRGRAIFQRYSAEESRLLWNARASDGTVVPFAARSFQEPSKFVALMAPVIAAVPGLQATFN